MIADKLTLRTVLRPAGTLSTACRMNNLLWPRSSQHADPKSGEAKEPLLHDDAARQYGDDGSSDAVLLDQSYDAYATAAPDHAGSAAAPGKRRMSPFAWLLLAAAVRCCLPLCMGCEAMMPHE